jgi:hypothetical protein
MGRLHAERPPGFELRAEHLSAPHAAAGWRQHRISPHLLASGFITQDAYAEVKPGKGNGLLIQAGLQYVPLCRNCIASPPALLAMDFGSYSLLNSGVTSSSTGRDVGFLAKGYLLDNKLEYRAGVFSGARASTNTVGSAVPTQVASNSLRGAGRVALQLLDAEPISYAMPMTYLGRRKVLQLGVGGDLQSSYRAYSADAFLSYPVGTDGVTLSGTFIHYDGSTFFTGLPKQNTFETEAGYHFNAASFTPWVKFETRQFDQAVKSVAVQDDTRFQVGGTYFVMGNNLNVKAAYQFSSFDRTTAALAPLSALTQNGFTLQLQAFYY